MTEALCYIDDEAEPSGGRWFRLRRAFFTTRPLEQQHGDDWNDAPYEHNAGRPYPWTKYDEQRGVEPYDVLMLLFDCRAMATPSEPPREHTCNSEWSVDRINARETPWLEGAELRVWAGASIKEFKLIIGAADGKVLEPAEVIRRG